MSMPNSDIATYIDNLELSTKGIKDEIYKISWYMRGGVTAQELLHIYSYEDRTIMSNIIKDDIETTQKTKLPFV